MQELPQDKQLTVVISPPNHLSAIEWKKWAWNVLEFTTPTLIVFFAQLELGVPIKLAWPVALIALYGSIKDLLKKFQSESITRK